MNRSLDERNRLSFFSPHYLEASGHLSTSTTTSSPLASLEDLQSCHDDVHFGQEDLLRIKAHRVAATSSPPPHHQYQQSSGEGPPPPPPPPPAAAAQEGQWAENEDYKDDDDDEVGHGWANQRKHFFILSNAGKPIYSRHGDEQKLCALMGVVQAILSFVTSSGDCLKVIYAGQHVMVFESRGPLFLVAIASTGEPAPVLRKQLDYLHLQIISTITAGITKIFESRPCFDLRSLLRGSTKFIDHLAEQMDKRPSYLLNATQCLPLSSSIRTVAGTYLQGIQSEDLVYALLIADGKLVHFVQMKRHTLQPQDLQLILNFLESSGTFRANETWVPICLPKFNDGGYLYAYLCYLNESTCLMLISTVRNSEKFYELSDWKHRIDKSLRAAGILEAITQSVSQESYKASSVGVPGLISFLYRHNTLHQFTSPSPDPPYHHPAAQMNIFRRYQRLYGQVVERPSWRGKAEKAKFQLPEHPFTLRQFWKADDSGSSLVWVTSDALLFILLEPWVGRVQAVQARNTIVRWVKSHEANLFILPTAIQFW